MSIVINTNVASMDAQRNLTNNATMLRETMSKLSSGYRINRAGDDAAGLALSESMRAQIRGSQMALNNVQDGINLLNVADGAFQTIQDELQRIRELTVQAANETYSQAQRTAMNGEIDQLRADIDRISSSTQFNSVVLLSVSPASINIELGPNATANDTLSILSGLGDTRATQATGLNLVTAASGTIVSNASAQAYLTNVDAAISTLTSRRAALGALVNRLQGAVSNLQNSVENQAAAESRVRNVDVASETANMSRYQILQQASAAILAQANQAPQIALKLLGQ